MLAPLPFIVLTRAPRGRFNKIYYNILTRFLSIAQLRGKKRLFSDGAFAGGFCLPFGQKETGFGKFLIIKKI